MGATKIVMGNLLIYLENNEAWISLILSFLSIIITTILTVIIISQTSKLANKQSEQEKIINEQQKELQKRQIRLDSFEYKCDIYHALYKVFQLTEEFESFFEKIDLEKKSMDKLYQVFNICKQQVGIDVSEIMWLFKQSEFILPDKIFQSIYDIAIHFNEMTGDIAKFNLYPSILLESEIEQEKKNLLDDILYRSKLINEHRLSINSIMRKELDISNLEM